VAVHEARVVGGIGVVSAGIPLADYTPDFQPLSIGSASTRVSARVTFNVQSSPGWAAAEVLSYLFPTEAAYFDAQKEEAAISRLYGGIHYRSDIEIGKQVGKRVGSYTVSFARIDSGDRSF
jgi:hypothetical protein